MDVDLNTRRIGLFGGSFNPVTCGHLTVAQAAFEELELDRLYFIPASQSPFKLDQDVAEPQVRLRLLRLALAGWSRCEVDDREIKRGAVSYTVETLREYAREHPGARLFYLVGGDHCSRLPEWREPEELARLAEFVVCPRPGEVELCIPQPFRGVVLKGVLNGISASMVRARCRRGMPIETLVPAVVAEAIARDKLYLTNQ